MKRRLFLAGLAAAATWPFAASSRQAPARVGFLAGGAAASINSAYEIKTIKQGLADNGLVEGRDYMIEPRFAAGNYQRFPVLVRDLMQNGVDVILANAPGAISIVRKLAPTMPVVAIDADASSHERLPKMIELQRAVVPNGTSMAVLFNPANPPDRDFPESLNERAQAAGLSVTLIGFQSRSELEAAFATLAKKPPAAVHVMLDAATSDFIDRIPALALLNRLPAFANMPEFATFGGLIGFGPPREPLYLRAGADIKKILEGAKPGDLPVAPPPRSELWINRNSAKALGLSLPETLLASADKIVG